MATYIANGEDTGRREGGGGVYDIHCRIPADVGMAVFHENNIHCCEKIHEC